MFIKSAKIDLQIECMKTELIERRGTMKYLGIMMLLFVCGVATAEDSEKDFVKYQDEVIKNKKKVIKDQDEIIEKQNEIIKEKNDTIIRQNIEIKKLKEEIKTLQTKNETKTEIETDKTNKIDKAEKKKKIEKTNKNGLHDLSSIQYNRELARAVREWNSEKSSMEYELYEKIKKISRIRLISREYRNYKEKEYTEMVRKLKQLEKTKFFIGYIRTSYFDYKIKYYIPHQIGRLGNKIKFGRTIIKRYYAQKGIQSKNYDYIELKDKVPIIVSEIISRNELFVYVAIGEEETAMPVILKNYRFNKVQTNSVLTVPQDMIFKITGHQEHNGQELNVIEPFVIMNIDGILELVPYKE